MRAAEDSIAELRLPRLDGGAHNGCMVTIRIAAACILFLSLGGCVADDCDWEPIGASIRAPVWAPPGADPVGVCGRWVDIDGLYWSQSSYTFELDAQALERIGQADATSMYVSPLGSSTTYEIAGVDPDEAVAMGAADGTFLVFTRDGGGNFPAELCPMLAPEGNPAALGSCP